MKIRAIIENTSATELPVEHGLSLWIEACSRKFFFDLGQGSLFADNAAALGVNVNDAEFAIVSHGHYDHGGGIATFIECNDHAPVLLNCNAFTECYSMKENHARYIGLSPKLKGHARIKPIEGVHVLSPGLTLFAGCNGNECFPPSNHRILKKVDGKLVNDDFLHEQSLIIEEGNRRLLIAGCAHSGILNIMAKAEAIVGAPLTDVIAGMHLTGITDTAFIDKLAHALIAHSCHFYTCHCTGEEAYQQLKAMMGEQIEYIREGDFLTL